MLRELAPVMPGAKPLALARACRPEITAAEVTETLNFLVKAGLLQKDKDGNYKQTERGVTTGPMEVTPIAVREMHRQMGLFALKPLKALLKINAISQALRLVSRAMPTKKLFRKLLNSARGLLRLRRKIAVWTKSTV